MERDYVLGAGILFMRVVLVFVCWRWFVVPLGFPSISLMHAMGLMALISPLTHYWIAVSRYHDYAALYRYCFFWLVVALVAHFILIYPRYYW